MPGDPVFLICENLSKDKIRCRVDRMKTARVELTE
nr:MAG TPA: NF-KAPPA-B P65, NF-KAPPA-B P50, I-KAPPA-B-ALPHA (TRANSCRIPTION REGULATION-ANK REPEAT), ANKYRIN.7A [Caudoviricetes sp.]